MKLCVSWSQRWRLCRGEFDSSASEHDSPYMWIFTNHPNPKTSMKEADFAIDRRCHVGLIETFCLFRYILSIIIWGFRHQVSNLNSFSFSNARPQDMSIYKYISSWLVLLLVIYHYEELDCDQKSGEKQLYYLVFLIWFVCFLFSFFHNIFFFIFNS